MKEQIRCLIYSAYCAPYKGNFITTLAELQKRLKAEGGEAVFLFPKESQNLDWTTSLEGVSFLTGNPIRDIFLIAKIIRRQKINLVHTHFCQVKDDMLFKFATAFHQKTVTVRHMHMIYRNKKNKLAEALKRAISNADIEIACSDYAKNAMTQSGFRAVKVITNAVDFKRLDAPSITRKNRDITEKNILMFGFGYEVKGVDLAIKALQRLNNPHLRLKICIAANKEELIDKIKTEFGEIPTFVELLPPTEEIVSYYKNADIFLSASRRESFCFAIREAGYCECVLVASNIDEHILGFHDILFENGNDESLAEALKRALTEDSSYTAQQKEYIATEYSIEKWCKSIDEIYREAISNSKM